MKLTITAAQYGKILKSLKNIPLSSFAVSRPHHPKAEHYGVPDLNQSIEKYLMYAKPLVPQDQMENTIKIASEYVSLPQVKKLQEALVKRAKMEDNWLFDWWLTSYLSYREPVVVHTSPSVKMKTVSFRNDEEWLSFATSVVVGVLNYKSLLESNSLDTEYFPGGEAMCMEQYYAILSNCRIPGTPHDRLSARMGGPFTTKRVNHICVFYRNRLYLLEFSDEVTHEVISPSLIYRQLEYIVSTAQKESLAPPVGLLTTLPRDDWNRVHSSLRQTVANANIMTKLEKSLFVLCLDDSADLPAQSPLNTEQPYLFDNRETASTENLLHGRLTNSSNRWFDKTVQFIVTRDGCIGLNFEHTAADAGAMFPMVHEVYETLKNPISPGATRLPVYAHPQELSWMLPKTIEKEFDNAEELLRNLIQSVDVQYGEFRKFGSSAIKKVKASPDAFFQMALQLAYARLHPDLPPPPTYETGSLRRFYLGRTDTIRSCSQESVQFTRGMMNSNCPPAERVKLLRAALNRHKLFTNDVLAGQAFDRHLLGLRLLAENLKKSGDKDFQEPQILFTDPTYAAINQYRLSTSQTRTPDDAGVAFGPVCEEGYGVCYNIHADRIQVNASSFNSSSQSRPPLELLENTFQALTEMLDLLEQSGEEK